MSIFGSIKDAIFGQKAAAAPAPAPSAPAAAPIAETAPITNEPVLESDVMANLAELAKGSNLNWQTSIVDLMKMLGIDSSLANRKELAAELGYTGALDGSAEMNIWLHKATISKLAESGGGVPDSITD